MNLSQTNEYAGFVFFSFLFPHHGFFPPLFSRCVNADISKCQKRRSDPSSFNNAEDDYAPISASFQTQTQIPGLQALQNSFKLHDERTYVCVVVMTILRAL